MNLYQHALISSFISNYIILYILLKINRNNLNFATKKISIFHSIQLLISSVGYLWGFKIQWEKSMGYSAGYALFDISLHIFFFNEMNSYIMPIHHMFMGYSTTYYTQFPQYQALCFLTESSTIFLHIAYIELKTNGKTILFQITKIMTLTTYIIFRLFGLFLIMFKMYKEKIFIGIALICPIWVMNIRWFWKLLHV